ncbi:MAG TPA: 2Fe-2S iron-sulfur cluster-binding protein [Polyangiaceae bacterium]|nr:2Fe-2S iron-sulfur cluster-binding protein [Polyangiaceae bacterium]
MSRLLIHFRGQPFELFPNETLLAGLERQGAALPAFCRTGVCQTCVLRATSGRPPARSQVGLQDSWLEQGCFLACQCVPEQPLEVELCDAVGCFDSRVARVEPLSPDVLRVELEAPAALAYRAGQYLHVEREGGVARPYSLASVPGSPRLELHVRRIAGGAMSAWFASALGEPVRLRGPFGECFHFDQEPERPLLLAGSGTGLAPLLGIVRAALAAGHRGPIHLYHGSASVEGLYLRDELASLAASAPNLRVTCSVLSAAASVEASRPGCAVLAQPLDRLILDDPLDFSACRVYLCGNPDLVARLRQRVYLSGAPRSRIHCDPFVAPAATA